ncbi:DUF3465 domain-containing protein [uncultured Microbulbifer sp.]|uniref:DUF3465 domain-containing protein n=1 Tax=uncultured Microbulbifer sp. TaxID=348147 RepID=UPI0025F9A4EB|nr:DUF3465 domain-containing protein [uncultured Microbulbifer sp.]
MKKLLVVILIIFGVYEYTDGNPGALNEITSSFGSNQSDSDDVLELAYKNRASNLQVSGSGEVIRILPDDLNGSRHQKFILKLSSGQTLLMAHNIDLAPRIEYLQEGDRVDFYGEYEWNSKGGVMHWTHHDPNGEHEDGWLVHNGRKFQ